MVWFYRKHKDIQWAKKQDSVNKFSVMAKNLMFGFLFLLTGLFFSPNTNSKAVSQKYWEPIPWWGQHSVEQWKLRVQNVLRNMKALHKEVLESISDPTQLDGGKGGEQYSILYAIFS